MALKSVLGGLRQEGFSSQPAKKQELAQMVAHTRGSMFRRLRQPAPERSHLSIRNWSFSTVDGKIAKIGTVIFSLRYTQLNFDKENFEI